jgi:hypothetical protein
MDKPKVDEKTLDQMTPDEIRAGVKAHFTPAPVAERSKAETTVHDEYIGSVLEKNRWSTAERAAVQEEILRVLRGMK